MYHVTDLDGDDSDTYAEEEDALAAAVQRSYHDGVVVMSDAADVVVALVWQQIIFRRSPD